MLALPQKESKSANPHPYIIRHLGRHPAPQPPPPKRIKICEPSPIRTSDDTLPDSPPKTNPKNLRTLTPKLEVRTPIAKAIWGKKKAPNPSQTCQGSITLIQWSINFCSVHSGTASAIVMFWLLADKKRQWSVLGADLD